jgi:tetratricopeptide (TPR) repeat protein
MNNIHDIELIEKYLDHQLPEEQARQLEQSLQHNAELSKLADSIKIARDAVRSRALAARIQGLHKQNMAHLHQQAPVKEIPLPGRRQSFRWLYQIAASLLLGILCFGTYQYVALNKDTFYEDAYIAYQLPVARTDGQVLSSIDSLYLAGNYRALVQKAAVLPVKEPRTYFLTGLSLMELKQFDEAIGQFTALQQINRQRNTRYFEQETEYYLALAYIGAGRVQEAKALFEKIYNSPRHLYKRTVSRQDLLKLNVLEFKN